MLFSKEGHFRVSANLIDTDFYLKVKNIKNPDINLTFLIYDMSSVPFTLITNTATVTIHFELSELKDIN